MRKRVLSLCMVFALCLLLLPIITGARDTEFVTVTLKPGVGSEDVEKTINVEKDSAFTLPSTMVFTPKPGYMFKNWLVNGEDKYPGEAVTATANTEITAQWSESQSTIYTLAVENGSGSEQYAEGTLVTITANTPASGKQFKEWTGVDNLTFIDGTSKTTATAKFYMPAKSFTVAATYEPIPVSIYAVNVNSGSGSGNYAEGETVTITATVPNGKTFLEWSSNDGVTFADTSAVSTTFTMPGKDVSVTANFKDKSVAKYTVTVTSGVGGTVAVDKPECAEGETVTITAHAANGKVFSKWSSNDGVKFADASAASTTFTMPAKDVTITATYEDYEDIPPVSPVTYALTVEGDSGSGQYTEGTSVTITANKPASGKMFKEWTGTNGLVFTNGGVTTSTATFTMPAKSVSVTATYTSTYEDVPQTTYRVTVNGGSGSGRYAENERVTITASSPVSGKRFKEWVGTDGLNFTRGNKSSSSATFTMPARNVTLTATTAESFFTEPIYTAPTSDKYISATSALIHEYQYIEDAAPEGATYRSGRLIVDANKTLPDLSRFKPVQIVVDNQNNYLIQFSQPSDAESCAKYLKSLAYVSYAEPDGIIKEFSTNGITDSQPSDNEDLPTAPETPNSWGVSATGADTYAANLLKRGISASVTVAVVDTGVDSAHPFLSGRLLSGYDLVDDDAIPQDGAGHGTHVSGTVVDCTPGLNVKVLPVRVLDDNGAGHYSTVAQGIRYAADNGANVINLSLGGGHSAKVESAISYAISKNITVVIAAGNENSNTSNVCPAHVKDGITVAAVDIGTARAYFSNYGDAVDIAAPGVDIKSCIPGGNYGFKDGTSMATPHVSAAAALLLYII